MLVVKKHKALMPPRNRNVEMFSFSNGGIQCLNIKNVTKSMEISKILLTFVAELEQTEKNGCVEGSNG